MQFTKPFILVTRIGDNYTNNPYHNPLQRYYEYDNMRQLFYRASKISGGETPVAALRITNYTTLSNKERDAYGNVYEYQSPSRADYFHNFTKALEEYKQGIRV